MSLSNKDSFDQAVALDSPVGQLLRKALLHLDDRLTELEEASSPGTSSSTSSGSTKTSSETPSPAPRSPAPTAASPSKKVPTGRSTAPKATTRGRST